MRSFAPTPDQAGGQALVNWSESRVTKVTDPQFLQISQNMDSWIRSNLGHSSSSFPPTENSISVLINGYDYLNYFILNNCLDLPSMLGNKINDSLNNFLRNRLTRKL